MKIGIFGGSFDPVHYGHISIAVQAREELGLSKIIFMPARVSPFKTGKKPADGKMRAEMIELSLEHYDGAAVSMYELERDEVSYTVHTLNHFRDILGEDDSIYFITGTDSFLTIDSWYRADELLSQYSFVIGARPGYMENELDEKIKQITLKYGCEAYKIHNRHVDVSSSEIRARVAAGLSLAGLVNPKVERYINEHGLYR